VSHAAEAAAATGDTMGLAGSLDGLLRRRHHQFNDELKAMFVYGCMDIWMHIYIYGHAGHGRMVTTEILPTFKYIWPCLV